MLKLCIKEDKSYIVKFLLYCASSAFFLAVVWFVFAKIDVSVFDFIIALRDRGYSEDNMYAAQISATFTIVSLVSLLSGTGEEVLWENTVRFSLINPKVINFISLATSLITNLVASSIAFWGNYQNLYFAYFIIDLVLLCIMTYKMIGAFFARQSIKKQLITKYKLADSDKKKYMMLILQDKTLTLIVENKYQLIQENLDFLYEMNEEEYLVNLLKDISKRNPRQYWDFINKYGMQDNKSIYDVSESLCISLIENKKDIDLCRKIIQLLYNPKVLNAQIEELKSKTRTIALGINGPSGYFDLSNMSTQQFILVKDHYGGMSGLMKEIETQISKQIETINKNMENLILECIKLPIEMVIMAMLKDNITVFEMLLDYIIDMRKSIEKIISEYVSSVVLVSDTNSNANIINSQVRNGIDICFLTMEDRELIQKILENSIKYVSLTEDNVKKIISFGLNPIMYSDGTNI